MLRVHDRDLRLERQWRIGKDRVAAWLADFHRR